MIAMNSISRRINTNETLQKTKIKYKIECIGFFELTINMLNSTAKEQKISANKKGVIFF